MQSAGVPEQLYRLGPICWINTSRRKVIERDAPDLFSDGAITQTSSLNWVAIS